MIKDLVPTRQEEEKSHELKFANAPPAHIICIAFVYAQKKIFFFRFGNPHIGARFFHLAKLKKFTGASDRLCL